MLLAHVRLQLLVFLKFELAAFKLAYVLLVALAMDAAHVSGSVCVGCKGLLTAIHSTFKRLDAAMTELVSGQVIGAIKRLTAICAVTYVWLYTGMFT